MYVAAYEDANRFYYILTVNLLAIKENISLY